SVGQRRQAVTPPPAAFPRFVHRPLENLWAISGYWIPPPRGDRWGAQRPGFSTQLPSGRGVTPPTLRHTMMGRGRPRTLPRPGMGQGPHAPEEGGVGAPPGAAKPPETMRSGRSPLRPLAAGEPAGQPPGAPGEAGAPVR